MRNWQAALIGGCAILASLVGFQVGARQLQNAPIPHDVGQSVTPSFEGWYKNADGTLSLSFGYMNRNFEERLDIPVGPNNRIEPGPTDQGQPTHFLPRRQTGIFTVVVPKDFGNQTLTWTLAAHGETISIPGHLRPEWEIDALLEATSGNTPPVVKFDPAGKTGQGPGGTTAQLHTTVSSPATITVWVTDDGIQKRSLQGRPSRLGVVWSKYRGRGGVTFSETTPQIDDGGKAVTTATFDEPGEYVLRVHAYDDSGRNTTGFQCCWTNGYLEVTVRN